MSSTLGSLVVFVVVVGLVVALGITVGMIVAGRVDRMTAPPRPIGPRPPGPAAEPGADPASIEEHDQ